MALRVFCRAMSMRSERRCRFCLRKCLHYQTFVERLNCDLSKGMATYVYESIRHEFFMRIFPGKFWDGFY